MVRRESSNIGSATNESLFLEDRRRATAGRGDGGRERSRSRSRTPDDFWGEEERYNENGPAVKRRRTGDLSMLSLVEDEGDGKGGDKEKEAAGDNPASRAKPKPKAKTSGPFIDESDSEEDLDAFREVDVEETVTSATDEPKPNTDGPDQPTPDTPLVREATSHIDEEYANFDDLGEGEEGFLEPLSPAGNECEEEAVCPICQGSLVGLSEVVRPLPSVVYRCEAN